jgi:drug/metabolite transporter (DMT)-like permease
MTEIALPRGDATPLRRPRLGYTMTLVAATLFAVNGAVSKVLLDTGISPLRLSELRATAGAMGLALGLALLAPDRLRLSRRDIPFLLFYGICGFAIVQWLYFVAIRRLPIGIALLLEFTAPVLVALWARYAWHEPVRRRVWLALALSLTGLALVAEIWSGLSLDAIGVTAGLLDAVVLAVFFLAGERGVQQRDPLSLVCYALFAAALFWAVVQPWWSFPYEELSGPTSLHGHLAGTSVPVWPLYAWLVVMGTIVPFSLMIGSLRHLPATTVGIVATFEPVAAAAIAWVWLGESLDPSQLVGGGIVLAGIVLAETSR